MHETWQQHHSKGRFTYPNARKKYNAENKECEESTGISSSDLKAKFPTF